MHSNEQIRVRGLNRVTQPTPSEKRLFLLRDCFALVYEGLEDFVVEVMSFIKLIKVLSVCIPVTRVTMVGEFDTLGKLGSAHWAQGTPPSGGGVPCARWAEPNYPSVINKPAATRPDTSDKFMTEATSMSVCADYTILRLHVV